MQLLRAAALAVTFAAGCAFANDGVVELDYRLRPDRDRTSNFVTEATTTFRVLEDRGVIARSNGRLSAAPMTVRLIDRQSVRFVTGSARSDGSFDAEMHYLEKSTSLKGPDGAEQRLPDRIPLRGVKVLATVQADGRVQDGSVVVSGLEAPLVEAFRPGIASALNQAASIAPLMLIPGQGVPQRMSMQIPLPIPGLSTFDVRMLITNRLLEVKEGIARVEQVYSMEFGVPGGSMNLTADGSGGGVMMYEIATQLLLSSETGTLMNMTLKAPDGVIELQMNSRQSQHSRHTAK